MRLVLLLLICGVIALSQATTGKEAVQERVLFLASSLTTTFMSVSTLTSIVPFTCYASKLVAADAACLGKRKKRRSLIKIENSLAQLDSTQLKDEIDLEDTPSGRFLFTVWKTEVTTKTFTSFSTNRAVSVSVLAICNTIAGAQYALGPVCNY